MSQLVSFINEVIQDVDLAIFKKHLYNAFSASETQIQKIERAFTTLTQSKPEQDSLARFFHNWSMTNNSATGLSGYCNRLTMHWRAQDSGALDKHYLKALSHLHRISDEDLGVKGGTIHFDMYYRMATMICGDDAWLSRAYLMEEAAFFKHWKDQQLLKEKDLFRGFLATLVHEIYTHGEVEYILPLFQDWLAKNSTLSEREQKQCLSWIAVHTSGTEKRHFNEALQAAEHLQAIFDVNIEDYDLTHIFCNYLTNKANTMEALRQDLLTHSVPLSEATEV